MEINIDSPNKGNYRLMTLILSENQSHKCVRLAKELGYRGGLVIIGKGTVSSTVLNLLGIKNQRKEIVNYLLKAENAKEILDCFSKELQLNVPGHGIAFTTPVIKTSKIPELEINHGDSAANTDQRMEEKIMFKKLTVIVDRGMSDEVMDIARKAGVRGGTILHGRGAGAEIATNLFGVEIEPEKELVMILMPDELVDKVMNALTQELNMDEPGKGIMFVEPVLDTRGLYEMRDNGKNNE